MELIQDNTPDFWEKIKIMPRLQTKRIIFYRINAKFAWVQKKGAN